MGKARDAYWIAREIRAERRAQKKQPKNKLVKQVTGAEVRSFAWRFAIAMVGDLIGLTICCTIVGLPLGIAIIWFAHKPLTAYFKWQLEMRTAAEEAVDNKKHQQEIRNLIVQFKMVK